MMKSSQSNGTVCSKKTRGGRTLRERTRRSKVVEGRVTLESFHRRAMGLMLPPIRIVKHQLGYEPLNIVDIGAKIFVKLDDDNDALEYPQIILLYPLNANNLKGKYAMTNGMKPFPTTIWMTCPILHARISKLEDLGWVSKLQSRLNSGNPDWLNSMQHAHKAYADLRWDMLTEGDKEYVRENGWESALRDVGIAGIKDFTAVKCLHTHFAHHLAYPEHGNIIGVWVKELLEAIVPDDPPYEVIAGDLVRKSLQGGESDEEEQRGEGDVETEVV